jgi:MFS family permease
MSAALATLRITGFRRIAVAYLVNELGNWLGEVALAILVFELTGSPIATAALFVAMQFVPALTAPPLVGRFDALTARRALALLYLGEAASFAALALLAADATFLLVPVLALAALDGTFAAAARARTRAAAAAVLGQERLRAGNAVLNVAFTTGAAAGPALAGVLVAATEPQVALMADAATFLAIAALLAATRVLPAAHGSSGVGWIEPLREGLRYVRARRALRGLLGAEALVFVFFALVLPVEVALAKDTLDAGDRGYGFLLASWGVGMVAGGVAFGGLGKARLGRMLLGSTLLIALAYLGTAASPTIVTACAASLVGGFGNGIQWVALITAVQGLTAAGFQARVVAMLESLSNFASGAGFLLGGVLAAALSPRAAYAAAGLGVLAVAAGAVYVLRDIDRAGGDTRYPAQTQADAPESAQI